MSVDATHTFQYMPRLMGASVPVHSERIAGSLASPQGVLHTSERAAAHIATVNASRAKERQLTR
ncbi:hypothetical protein CERSUDRAFT_101290 [Gelatoporia subvermispora B]|uniref:Uncharacterized protein n=1 Tax=Ceriporiopsis subvermispora (strain B) TaxID=914234 RepID=M2Q113_CERS8|nr:hypothetical protein CERSUDRAFT_101290 [Gelatoporia subvermispora B]